MDFLPGSFCSTIHFSTTGSVTDPENEIVGAEYHNMEYLDSFKRFDVKWIIHFFIYLTLLNWDATSENPDLDAAYIISELDKIYNSVTASITCFFTEFIKDVCPILEWVIIISLNLLFILSL